LLEAVIDLKSPGWYAERHSAYLVALGLSRGLLRQATVSLFY